MAPPRKDTEPLTLRLPKSLINEIDDARRNEPDIPTRPELIRRVLEAWVRNEVYKSE
jgi:hypothetical protein